MVRQLVQLIYDTFTSVSHGEFIPKSHQIELVGDMLNKRTKSVQHVIVTVTLKHFVPRDDFGEGGYFYTKERERKVKNKETKQWEIIKETVNRYEMSEADMKFIYNSYVNCHLTQRQISKLSGIPEPYVFRYIKHKKLKPKYPKIERRDRVQPLEITNDVGFKFKISDVYDEPKVDVPDDFGVKPFHLDPFPSASEWKARREGLGLKNGENWRGTAEDENPGPRQYGDGHVAAKKNLAKLARKEKRKKKAINKFNAHQNNRYGITKDNPEGTKDPYKKYRDELIRKKNLGKEKKETKNEADSES